ncbi:hypothetical protein ACFYRN_25240 [Streptomyces sp. NPDC005227]|uniref:hypothetical protein n=1 Tax=Streptomyces sp. NPDC005227 TaxID=3364707 RepID=UPI00369F13DE
MSGQQASTLARYFARRGTPAFTYESYSRSGMLSALRELRRRGAHTSNVKFLSQVSHGLARDLAEVIDLPPADIATVLLAAGGAIGVLAEQHDLSALEVAGALQYTADDLDQAAKASDLEASVAPSINEAGETA